MKESKSSKSHMTRRFFATVAVAVLATLSGGVLYAQVAVKTNLLYDATTSPNLGVEVGVAPKSTVQLVYGLNPWEFSSERHGDRQAKHWVLMPEYRWWTCSRFNGHFVGVHALGGQFNAANVDIPLPGGFFGGDNIRSQVRSHSYEGGFAGGGFTYGYQWIVRRHFNVEVEAGVGYSRVWYDKYECGECGPRIKSGHTNYVGLTKLGLSLVYLF